MQGTVFNQANAMVATLRNDLTVQHQNLIQTVVELQNNNSDDNDDVAAPTINQVTADATQLPILEALQELQLVMRLKRRNGGNHNVRLKHTAGRMEGAITNPVIARTKRLAIKTMQPYPTRRVVPRKTATLRVDDGVGLRHNLV